MDAMLLSIADLSQIVQKLLVSIVLTTTVENVVWILDTVIEKLVRFMMRTINSISLSKSFKVRLEELLRFEKGDVFSKIDKSWTIRLSAVLEKP